MQIAPWVTTEVPIRIGAALRVVLEMVFALLVFIAVVCADGHCNRSWCLARVVYSEWCRKKLHS